MKQSEASDLVRRLLIVIVKFKSDARESIERDNPSSDPHVVDMVLEQMYPWLFNEKKNIVLVLDRVVNKLDDGQPLPGIDFYNLMVAFHRFMPEVKDTIELAFELKLPYPQPSWVMGWEEE